VRRAAITLLCVLLGTGCAAGGTRLLVCLDFLPNPNHVPLYAALASGRFAAAGLDVDLIVPGSASDPVKLAAVGSVDLALTPQINYLIARAEGLPLMAIGALIDGALGGLLALSDRGVERIEDLTGGTIGYSLAPLEPALWETMLTSAGVSPSSVELVHVGFNTVVSLLTGRVDAIGAFRNVEPIQVELLGHRPVFFPQEDYGVPDTYELLFVASAERVGARRDALSAFLNVLASTVADLRSDPGAAYALYVRENPDLDDELNRQSYERTLGLYADGLRHDVQDRWHAMQTYLVERGLMQREIPIEALYTADLLPKR